MSTTMLTCPACASVAEVDLAHRDAAGFCPSCDYPLFWARPSDVDPSTGDEGDDEGPHRRAPGAVGTHAYSALPCPSCAELNLPGTVTCWRCGAAMEPEPPPEPVEEPPPEPEPAPQVVVVPEPIWGWWLGLAAGVVVLAFVLAGWVPW